MKTAKEMLNEKWRGATNTENYFIALEAIEYAEQEIAKNLHKPHVGGNESDKDVYNAETSTAQKLEDKLNGEVAVFCHLKETADNEVTLVRESETGLKYLIASDDLISYGRVGKNIGESECVYFNGTNGKKILQEWAK